VSVRRAARRRAHARLHVAPSLPQRPGPPHRPAHPRLRLPRPCAARALGACTLATCRPFSAPATDSHRATHRSSSTCPHDSHPPSCPSSFACSEGLHARTPHIKVAGFALTLARPDVVSLSPAAPPLVPYAKLDLSTQNMATQLS
jgi:hypothetical protein